MGRVGNGRNKPAFCHHYGTKMKISMCSRLLGCEVLRSIGPSAGTPVDVGTCPHQVLAVNLTLFQPGERADYAHHILMSPPPFESHRHACSVMAKIPEELCALTTGKL